MDRHAFALEPTTPLSLQVLARLGLPPFAGGLAIGCTAFAIFLAYSTAFGAAPARLAGVGFERGWLAELIQDFFLGFAVAVVAASVRGARHELEALRPCLTAPLRGARDLERSVLGYPRALLAAIGLSSIASAFATVMSPGLWIDGRMPGWTHPTVIWLFCRNAVTWWIVMRGLVLELVIARHFSLLAEHVEHVDLLDRSVFAPFARRALRSVLLWMLLAAWVSLTWLGRGWAVNELMLVGLLTLATFAFAAFLLPLVGPHRRLRAAKEKELARVRGVLAAVREHALHAHPNDLAGGRLADLVAWEARVASSGEWPLEPTTLARFGLYLALGLGSWVGAGLVQHAIERAIS